MKTIVAVFCVFAAVTATPLFGTEQCANGPGAWCVNIQTAKQCNAVTHCQQTMWNKPVVNSVPCDLCKEFVTVVGNFLKDNATQRFCFQEKFERVTDLQALSAPFTVCKTVNNKKSEALAFLDKVCDFLHDPSMVSECKQLVAEYYPLVLNIIEQELSNPSVPCCALGLCQSLQQYLASLKPVQLTTNEIPDVDLSKVVSPFLANIPFLLKPEENNDLTAENKDICQDCLQLLTDVQDTLKTNSSFSKMLIENLLKQCDQLGGGLSEMCKTYINQYAELALQMLIQMPARDLCCTAGLCSKKASPLQELIPAKVIIPAKKMQPAIKVTEPKMSESGVFAVCDLCQLVIENLKKLLDRNCSRGHIKEALEKVCDVLPSKYRSKCKDFVDTYSDLILEIMEEEADPKMICMAMGLCSTREPQMVKLDSSETCEVCKMVMMYLDSILGQNATKEKIKEAIEKICNFLPESMLDQCHSLITTYEDLIIDLLLKEMDPNSVCVKMNLCKEVQKPLLGTEKCMWGPSYWCKDLETAGRCNAIEHCKRHVWN